MAIRQQRRNINKHTKAGSRALDDSISRDGLIGAITTAADGETFDGSDRVRILGEVLQREPMVVKAVPGQPIIVDNDGTSPIINRRIDIPNADDQRAVRLGFAANQIAAMNWSPDVELLRTVLDNDPVSAELAEQDKRLQELLKRSPDDKWIDADISDAPIGGEASVMQLKNVATFPSSNALGFPDLLPDMLADVPDDLATWGGDGVSDKSEHYLVVYHARSYKGLDTRKCVLAFYTYDYKFESIFSNAGEEIEKLLPQQWLAVVSPNFSQWYGDPRVVQMYQAFKSVWCARFFQGVGYKVIPDVNWSDEKSFEYCVLGIPKNPPCVSIQLQTQTKQEDERKQRENGLRLVCDLLNPQSFLIYGCERAHRKRVVEILNRRVVFVDSIAQLSRRKVVR